MSRDSLAPVHLNARTRTWLVVFLASMVALGAGVTWVWLDRTQGGLLLASEPIAALHALAWVSCCTMVCIMIRWLRWAFLLRRCNVRMRTRDTALLFLATLPAGLTPLYLGELLRVAIVRRHDARVGPAMFWVWLVERASDAGALFALWGWAVQRPWMCLTGALVLTASPFALALIYRSAHPQSRLGAASASAVVSVGLSLSAWALPCFSMRLAIDVLGGNVDTSTAFEAFAKGTLLGGLSALPGGVGVTGSAAIDTLLRRSVEPALAAASVAVLRAGTTWFAAIFGILMLGFYRSRLLDILRGPRVQAHFDELSVHYAATIPEYVRERLIERKVEAIVTQLGPPSGGVKRGLDVGCGQGWYAVEFAKLGWCMSAVEVSSSQLEHARGYAVASEVSLDLHKTAGVILPFADATFDFAYSINVLHHVTSVDDQAALLREIRRVLKPGAAFYLHEMNTENPVFRLYMSYLFPLFKEIDEGTERWIRPTRLPDVSGATWSEHIVYFTFLPDFIPHVFQRLLTPLERVLERSPVRRYSAHYMATLRSD